jgi:hypothetical protein
MVSTQNLDALLSINELKKVCKAIAVLDAILSQEWEYRFYSYNEKWAEGEECATMRNGSGDEYLILFNQHGAVINGFAHESEMNNWEDIKAVDLIEKKIVTESVFVPWEGIFDNLPSEFHEFIYGEPVKSTGTTFCIWQKYNDTKWHIGNIELPDDDYKDGSEDLLKLLDGDIKKYKEHAEDFDFDKITLKYIKHIYNGAVLDEAIIKKINPDLEDWDLLISDLEEIGYPHNIKL